MRRVRVTITVRPDLLDAADRKSAELDRSRSRVFEQALEEYLRPDPTGALVAGEPHATYVLGLGLTRQAQLEADLALSPEERVRLAEDTAQVAELRKATPEGDRLVMFTRLEDFLDWQRRERVLS